MQFVKESRTPELPVVLLEDFGALTGLLIALIAITAAILTGNPIWDGIGTFSIGLLLGAIAIILAREMKSLLIGESAEPAIYGKIKNTIESSESVERLIHLQTQHLGPDNILVGAKVEFDASLGHDELATTISRVEREVRDVVPQASPMFIEPDFFRENYEPYDPTAPHGTDHDDDHGNTDDHSDAH